MTEEEWKDHLDYLDKCRDVSPYSVTVGGSQHYGHRQVIPYIYVTKEEEIEMSLPYAPNTNLIENTQPVAARELGRLGGKVKSEVKSTAARENGRKGGRPSKQLDIEDI